MSAHVPEILLAAPVRFGVAGLPRYASDLESRLCLLLMPMPTMFSSVKPAKIMVEDLAVPKWLCPLAIATG